MNKELGSKFWVEHETSEEAEGCIGQNIVNITIKMKTIVYLNDKKYSNIIVNFLFLYLIYNHKANSIDWFDYLMPYDYFSE